jgi:hypothetical protein
MSYLVNYVKSCQIMSFMSNHAIHDFSRNSVKSGGEGRGGGGGVKKVFLSLRRQLRCLAEGKNEKANWFFRILRPGEGV